MNAFVLRLKGLHLVKTGWHLRAQGGAWGRWHQGSFNELRWWAMFSDIARLPHLLVGASSVRNSIEIQGTWKKRLAF